MQRRTGGTVGETFGNTEHEIEGKFGFIHKSRLQ